MKKLFIFMVSFLLALCITVSDSVANNSEAYDDDLGYPSKIQVSKLMKFKNMPKSFDRTKVYLFDGLYTSKSFTSTYNPDTQKITTKTYAETEAIQILVYPKKKSVTFTIHYCVKYKIYKYGKHSYKSCKKYKYYQKKVLFSIPQMLIKEYDGYNDSPVGYELGTSFGVTTDTYADTLKKAKGKVKKLISQYKKSLDQGIVLHLQWELEDLDHSTISNDEERKTYTFNVITKNYSKDIQNKIEIWKVWKTPTSSISL